MEVIDPICPHHNVRVDLDNAIVCEDCGKVLRPPDTFDIIGKIDGVDLFVLSRDSLSSTKDSLVIDTRLGVEVNYAVDEFFID